ncbi:hypothetical protein O9X98_05510 [Agrobacterium salinitolerans]|nr:hypothetical protein [Agrobacterium salinitolerans]
MELQFDVPIAVKGRPEKYKTDRLVVATVPVSIDVEECSRGELKPAVSGSWKIDAATRLDYRSHAGKLYLPLCPLSMIERSMPLFELPNVPFHLKHASAFVEKEITDDRGWNGRSTLYPPSHREDVRKHFGVRLSPLSAMSFETLDVSALAEQVTTFERRASRLLRVDDMIHVEVSEPVISVTRSVNNPAVFLVRPIHRPYLGIRRDKSFPDALFRIDEAERASDFCRTLGAENQPLLNFHKFWIDVQDSEVLAINSTRACAYSAAYNLVRSIGVGAGVDHHACSEQLRELTTLVARHNEADCPDELCDRFCALVDIERSGTTVFKRGADAETAACISTAWDNREITFASNSFENHGVLKP